MDSMDSVLGDRIGEEEIDNENRFEHMELEYLEGIWEELFSR